jgi:hypothetical protein
VGLACLAEVVCLCGTLGLSTTKASWESTGGTQINLGSEHGRWTITVPTEKQRSRPGFPYLLIAALQLQLEMSVLRGNLDRLKRSQLGLGLLVGTLAALLVLRLPQIHQVSITTGRLVLGTPKLCGPLFPRTYQPLGRINVVFHVRASVQKTRSMVVQWFSWSMQGLRQFVYGVARGVICMSTQIWIWTRVRLDSSRGDSV